MSIELVTPDDAVNRNEVLSNWQGLLDKLAREVRIWSEARGWKVDQKTLTLEEEHLGTYDVPFLVIQHQDPQRPVFLEPVARYVMGAAGRVDLFSYPSMDRVMLLYDGNTWVIRPELGPLWPLPWSQDTFIDLVQRLTAGS
jgi:hypothetical protein